MVTHENTVIELSGVDVPLREQLTPALIKSASYWLASPAKVVSRTDSEKVLFVTEGSWAAVPRKSQKIQWVGTDDATTCHCIVCVSPKTVAVAHLNESSAAESNLNSMVEAVSRDCKGGIEIDVFIAGGMGGPCVPRNVEESSTATSVAVFKAIAALQGKFCLNLRLACVGLLNTEEGTGQPVCRGVCVSTVGGQCVQASFDDDARGHVLPMRCIAQHLARGVTAMYRQYDHDLDAFLVPAPSAEVCSRSDLKKYFDTLVRLPDDVLLQLSTSPGFEKQRFASDLRAATIFALSVMQNVGAFLTTFPTTSDGMFMIVPRLPSLED